MERVLERNQALKTCSKVSSHDFKVVIGQPCMKVHGGVQGIAVLGSTAVSLLPRSAHEGSARMLRRCGR